MDQDALKKSLYNSLKELGLAEMEINLYVVSLFLGPSNLSAIAKNMGISRPNVYKVIRGLEAHGLVKFSEKSKYARTFMVESPAVVLEKLREKRERMSQLDHGLVSSLPDLLTLYHQEESATKIKVLQGREQYLKIFNEILEQEKKEIQYFGSAEDFVKFISMAAENEWIKKRVKKNIIIKTLLLPSELSTQFKSRDKEELRETKILKGLWPFSTSFQLFANKVIIWQPKAPLVVLIEDQYIVEMLKSIFYKLWEVS